LGYQAGEKDLAHRVGGDALQPNDQWRPDVDVSSPDGSVRIIATVTGDIAVSVSNLDRQSEETLARQVRAAIRVALARLQDPGREYGARP
jgi:hypothetical protein